MLVQHAHALVAISQEAEGCAHTTRGNRGDPASYGVYTDVMAATTQAVKAVAHLTDHLLDPSLDAVAGAKPRFATQFARGFEGALQQSSSRWGGGGAYMYWYHYVESLTFEYLL